MSRSYEKLRIVHPCRASEALSERNANYASNPTTVPEIFAQEAGRLLSSQI
jgi:hypothetical protein